MNHPITIRRSTTGDAATVARIAALDSGRALADPFHRTAELVELLRYSVERDRGPRRRRIGLGRLPVVRPGTA